MSSPVCPPRAFVFCAPDAERAPCALVLVATVSVPPVAFCPSLPVTCGEGVEPPPGLDGCTGFEGFEGFAGLDGFNGFVGFVGFEGFVGFVGFEGVDGFVGFVPPAVIVNCVATLFLSGSM